MVNRAAAAAVVVANMLLLLLPLPMGYLHHGQVSNACSIHVVPTCVFCRRFCILLHLRYLEVLRNEGHCCSWLQFCCLSCIACLLLIQVVIMLIQFSVNDDMLTCYAKSLVFSFFSLLPSSLGAGRSPQRPLLPLPRRRARSRRSEGCKIARESGASPFTCLGAGCWNDDVDVDDWVVSPHHCMLLPPCRSGTVRMCILFYRQNVQASFTVHLVYTGKTCLTNSS